MVSATHMLEQLLSGETNWWLDDPDTIHVTGKTLSSTYVHETVADDLLASIHPSLPDAVRAQIAWSEQTRECSWTSGKEVSDTIFFLTNDMLQFRDDLLSSHWAMKDTEMFRVYEDPLQVWFKGLKWQIQESCFNGKQTYFVGDSFGLGIYANLDDLDKRYPGWYDRYKIGRDLGVATDDLLSMTFTSTPQISADIDSLRFD